jgi:hypothetical protein
MNQVLDGVICAIRKKQLESGASPAAKLMAWLWGNALLAPIMDWCGRHVNGAMLERICHPFWKSVMDASVADWLGIIATIVMMYTLC